MEVRGRLVYKTMTTGLSPVFRLNVDSHVTDVGRSPLLSVYILTNDSISKFPNDGERLPMRRVLFFYNFETN